MNKPGDITKAEGEKIVVATSMEVSASAYEVSEEDFSLLRSHGFSEEDVWDIAAISAFFGMSNRMANVTSMRPNDEFYTVGR